MYSRITSHSCEIYLTSRVGEYSRAFVFENRYIFHRYISLSHFRGLPNSWSFLCPPMFAYSAACEHISRYERGLVSFSNKLTRQCDLDKSDIWSLFGKCWLLLFTATFCSRVVRYRKYHVSRYQIINREFCSHQSKSIVSCRFLRRLHLNFPSSHWTPRCTWRKVSTHL